MDIKQEWPVPLSCSSFIIDNNNQLVIDTPPKHNNRYNKRDNSRRYNMNPLGSQPYLVVQYEPIKYADILEGEENKTEDVH